MRQITSVKILSAATGTGAGEKFPTAHAKNSFEACGTTGSGTGAATVDIQATNVDNPTTNDFFTIGTIMLTLGTTSTCDGFGSIIPYRYFRAKVTAISGTSASVDVWMGN